ncbi:MAG: hypothetical protein HBSAPP02_02010 [Phycisphaerae bacterium]|nr:MAG: hypothetical protein DCC66_05880 [Planctomycetota bacterium]GJQ25169.1 MAG: hypothetical protein HBSAPP02_02010 [Phycisphaerae bacterium]
MGRIADALKKAEQERAIRQAERAETAPASAGSSGAADVQPVPPNELVDRPAILTNRFTAEGSPAKGSNQVDPSVVAWTDRSSQIAEQYRAARTWLVSRTKPGERNCIAVTSSVSREGKSVTTANLAVTLAEIRHLRVLAMDGDLRGGVLGGLFGVPSSPGLADLLIGRCSLSEVLVKTALPNLWVMPAGRAGDPSGVAELLNSKALARTMEQIRERYDYILVDTPPVQRLADVGVIGALCTGIIMVVRMHKTPAHQVRQSVSWLQLNRLNVIGCIASACRMPSARYAYDPADRAA